MSFLLLAGEQTKALVTQLTLFNRVLTELREDIRDQVGLRGCCHCPGWISLEHSASTLLTLHALLPRR